MDNYFTALNAVDVSDKTERKNGLAYLSWAWAWGELKKRHPDATSTVYETDNGNIYHTDGKTCWVKTGVTVNGIEHIEYLPVMDHRNQAIPLERVTSTDVNKAIQRSLTKAIARHGIGLYIYAGEDLPEGVDAPAPEPIEEPKQEPVKFVCTVCGKIITPITYKGEAYPVRRIEAIATKNFGKPMCWDCMKKAREENASAE